MLIAVLIVIGVTVLVVFGLGGYAVVRFFRGNGQTIRKVDPDSMRFNLWPVRTIPERLPQADTHASDPQEE